MPVHPLAAAVVDRDLPRLGTHLSDDVHLRALLPSGSAEEVGRDAVLARFADWFTECDTIELADTYADDVGDRVLVHYKLLVDRATAPLLIAQTLICGVSEGRVNRIDLVSSGFRTYAPVPAG